MTAADFAAWLDRMVYNAEDAAEALGVTKRQVWRYLDGSSGIPPTVQKLCECLEERKRASRR